MDRGVFKHNLEILADVQSRTGCRILLAQKAFSMYHLYPMIGSYISGTTGSGLFEARLGAEEMGKENHVYAPAFTEEELREIIPICDHISLNSFRELSKFKKVLGKMNPSAAQGISAGLRVNPEVSTQEHAIYDPCAPGSRLGVTRAALDVALQAGATLDGVEGIHMHTLCEQGADALEATVGGLEERFGDLLASEQIKWLNLGGGHHITKADYDRDLLVRILNRLRDTYHVQVYLEPGEAVALDAGVLVTTVLDIVENGDAKILILDTSAACHMPDVLEMPYRPPLKDSFPAGEAAFTYTLSSRTCLAGDIIGQYAFDHEIEVGERLIFQDMAIYTMVKNNTFNGMPLPAIAMMEEDGSVEMVKAFGYEDFKSRL